MIKIEQILSFLTVSLVLFRVVFGAQLGKSQNRNCEIDCEAARFCILFNHHNFPDVQSSKVTYFKKVDGFEAGA